MMAENAGWEVAVALVRVPESNCASGFNAETETFEGIVATGIIAQPESSGRRWGMRPAPRGS